MREETGKRIIIISFTEAGGRLNAFLCGQLAKRDASGREWLCEGYSVERFAAEHGLLRLPEDMRKWIGACWGQAAFLFVGAAGIAMRFTAPWVKDKFTDSPVVVLDEKGKFVIPLLSGHAGGAVELARRAADCTGAVPVITTATDIQGKFAVDVFAVNNGLRMSDRRLAKRISAAVLGGTEVGVYCRESCPGGSLTEQLITQDSGELRFCDSPEELRGYPYGIAVTDGPIPEAMQKTAAENMLWLWKEDEPNSMAQDDGITVIRPRRVIAGIGCRKGAGKKQLKAGLFEVLKSNGILPEEVFSLASIDLKKEEEGICGLAEELGVSFATYPAKDLRTVGDVSFGSEFVRRTTGVDNVCERAARLAGAAGKLIQPKICVNGAAFALVKMPLRILLFAGTTEGRVLTEKLSAFPLAVYVSTATEYGKECLESGSSAGACVHEGKADIKVLAGRMDEPEMVRFINVQQINLVVDATHPYARVVTENIVKACGICGASYIRCLREQECIEDKERGHMVWTESVGEAVEYLKTTEGPVFISTGSKELKLYTEIADYENRCYARVLPTKEAVEVSAELGFKGSRLIAMQGPFSKELNAAMLKETGAKYFVTKESGKAGGFREKAEAAKETGAVLVVIGRPGEAGFSVTETVRCIRKLL